LSSFEQVIYSMASGQPAGEANFVALILGNCMIAAVAANRHRWRQYGNEKMTSVLPSCPPTASPPRPYFAPGHRLRHNRARRMHRGTFLADLILSQDFGSARSRLAVSRTREPTDRRNLTSERFGWFRTTVGWLQTNRSRKLQLIFPGSGRTKGERVYFARL